LFKKRVYPGHDQIKLNIPTGGGRCGGVPLARHPARGTPFFPHFFSHVGIGAGTWRGGGGGGMIVVK
jgi:hypothetical protein